MVLAAEPDIAVVGGAADPPDLIDLCKLERPDAVVLELDVDAWDAPRLAAALRRQQRSLRIVGTYETLPTELARRAVKAGIRVAAAHPAGSDGVVAALRAHDKVPLVSHLPTRLPAATPSAMLTPREIEVLTLIAEGHTAAEVACRLGISAKTVENRKQSIFAKLEVQNQAHAVAVALRSGVLPPRLTASGG